MPKSVCQHTIKSPFSVKGIGVHSGAAAEITVKPAPASSGVVFIRTDITDRPNVIPARWNFVTDTRLCTMLSNSHSASVSTVEHLLSAFAAVGLDNAVVEIDGPEIPIMDGSAACFVEALDKAGLKRQNARRRAIRIKKTVSFKDGDKEIFLSPTKGSFFSIEIAFDNKVIGCQKLTHELLGAAYRSDIAPARTFGFLHEVEQLRKMGLARGGSLENAIVIDGDKILNPEGLRFDDEFVRHKILDAIGDFYLAGLPIIGRYHGIRVGHAMNNAILRALFTQTDAFDIIELGDEVQKIKIPARRAYATADAAAASV